MNICLDTETTGLNPSFDEILQLSIIDSDTDEVLFYEYFKPAYTVCWEEAQAVNGISYEDVSDCEPIAQSLDKIQSIIDGAEKIYGYNVAFDVAFLIQAGIEVRAELVDVMAEFAKIYGEWNSARGDWKWQKLTRAAAYYHLDFDGTAHDSLADAKMTMAVYRKMHGKELIRRTTPQDDYLSELSDDISDLL